MLFAIYTERGRGKGRERMTERKGENERVGKMLKIGESS